MKNDNQVATSAEVSARLNERSGAPEQALMTPPPAAPLTLEQVIRSGDRVTILNRFGQQQTGRAVMRGPAGWVLNMGGAHGTPAIANDENITNVKPCKH